MALTNTYTPNNLRVAGMQQLTIPVTVTSGENLVEGQAVALTGGKVVALVTSGTFYGIMNESTDATSGDKASSIIYAGSVLGSEVTFASGDQAEFQESARAAGIYML